MKKQHLKKFSPVNEEKNNYEEKYNNLMINNDKNTRNYEADIRSLKMKISQYISMSNE